MLGFVAARVRSGGAFRVPPKPRQALAAPEPTSGSVGIADVRLALEFTELVARSIESLHRGRADSADDARGLE